MAYTVTPAVPLNAYVETTLRQVDLNGEPATKGFLLYNDGSLYQDAMRAYESLSQPGIAGASVSSKHVLSAQNTTAGSSGAFPKSGDVLLLVFTRPHPVASMNGKIITNEFAIIGPHPDIIDYPGGAGTTPVPLVTGGETFATAATRPEALGALIDWLEGALTVTVLNVRYPGGWTYNPAASRFLSLPKQYDGQ